VKYAARWKIFFGSAQPTSPICGSATRRSSRRASSRARDNCNSAKRPEAIASGLFVCGMKEQPKIPYCATGTAAGARRKRRQTKRVGTKSNAAQNKSGRPKSKKRPRNRGAEREKGADAPTRRYRGVRERRVETVGRHGNCGKKSATAARLAFRSQVFQVAVVSGDDLMERSEGMIESGGASKEICAAGYPRVGDSLLQVRSSYSAGGP